MSKSLSLFHITYIEDTKEFFKGLLFFQNLFYIKRFSNEIVFKFSKNAELKIFNFDFDLDSENRITSGMKDRK